MKLLVWLTLIFGLYECAEDSIDGNLLSNELKKFKQGIGVDYIQNEFNRLPYVTKTETGNQLLSKIQTSLDQALKDLQDVLENVKSTKNNNADRDTISLAKCCEKAGNYKYIPEFRKEVDFSKACVTISPNVVPNLLYPPSEISDAMKSNYEKNRNVLWQRYSTTKGVSIVYPSTYWNDCDNYDPRFTSSYAATASPKDKDVGYYTLCATMWEIYIKMRCAVVVFAIPLAFICGAAARPNLDEEKELKTLLLKLLDESNEEKDERQNEPQALEVKDAVKRVVIPGCQSGQGEIGYTSTERGKSNAITVTFNPAFSAAPAVVWGLTHLDSISSENVRINSEVLGLSATGFTLKINSWSPTLTYNAKVSWMACPK